ncbi:MAG: 50S ribosomal protein L24e [Candidatus Nanoarchaeia archaeon]|nr:50S ribosomal protein L24e [Candidatus Nanoarchaeia archaeon]
MVKCTFCSKELEKGTGKNLIQNDGKLVYFCSSKCERNMQKLGRKARNLKWVTKKLKAKK